MLPFIARRTALMVPVLLAISILSFIIIELPPGDYFSYYIDRLYAQGEVVDEGLIEGLRVQYGVDQPVLVQYLKWLSKIVRGDLGRSLNGELVIVIVRERLPWSVLITVVSFVFVHVVGIPIGVLSATKQYSIRDYIATFIGFIGLAVPNFLLALVLVWVWFAWTGQVQIGLFSREYAMAPWSLARLWDLLKHLIIPAVVIGTAGTAGTIRSIRANLLDELQKTYVTVARSKGLSEARVLYKYPFRIAINPWASTIGWLLPSLVSGEVLVSLVIGLPTLGPVLLEALLAQDLFLASSIIMILSTLTVIGTLVSDIVLAWVDPRIRQSV